MKMSKKTYFILGIFSVMFVYLLLQFHNVMVYFDDYGYYSLSYGVDIGQNGHDFTIGQVFLFLRDHYFNCNGRLPGYLIWLSTYSIGGLKAVQSLAALFTILVLVLLWRFTAQKHAPAISAVLMCAFYGLFTITVQKQGTYWFAAFFQYVAPIVPIILFLLLYFKYRENKITAARLLLLAVLVLFSAYSQEQLGAAITFMMCLLVVFELIQKKPWKHNVLFVLISLISAAVLMFGPATQSRVAGHGKTFLETLVGSTYATIHTFFSNEFKMFLIILFLALFAFSAKMLKKERYRLFVLADIVSMTIAAISVVIYCVQPIQCIIERMIQNRYFLIMCGGAVAAVIAVQIMRYYWQEQKYQKLILFMTAVGSIGCLCIVPEIPYRLFIPSWFLLFPAMCDGVISFSELFGRKKSICLIFVSCVILVIAAVNAAGIYIGYAANAEVWHYNDKILQQASDSAKSGIKEEKLFLKTYPYEEHYAAAPYNEGVAYITYWIKDYYDFTYNPEFYFSSSEDINISKNEYQHLDLDVYLQTKE